MEYYVEIVNIKTDEVVKQMGPMPYRKAERVERGALINLNRDDYFVRTVPCRLTHI